ncbi:MAG: ATP-binding protein [Myxococcales bacterium]|nr:ATP-binding protein [Myxococcales bacterium]
MSLRIFARDFLALTHLQWDVAKGVSLVVGPNGVGKTTALEIPEVMRHVYTHGPTAALEHHVGGAALLRRSDAPEGARCAIGVGVGDVTWQLEPAAAGAGISSSPAEVVRRAEQEIVARAAGDEFAYAGEHRLVARSQSAVRVAVDDDPDAESVLQPMVSALENYRLYRSYTYNLWKLQRSGSTASTNQWLHVNGENLFSVLRNWTLQRATRPHWEFVRDAMRELFPYFDDIDFEQAGQTVTVSVFRKGRPDVKVPVAQEATGFLMALLHLAAVASAPPNGIVAIDEPENSLHPRALQVLLEAIRERASQNGLTVLLATHSTVALDQFNSMPERVFVLESDGQTVQPVALSDLRNTQWLANYALGDLYKHGDFGAPSEG